MLTGSILSTWAVLGTAIQAERTTRWAAELINEKWIEIRLKRKALNLSSFSSVVHDILLMIVVQLALGVIIARSLGCAPVSPVLALLG